MPALTPLSTLLASAHASQEGVALPVSDDWRQGRSVFGGLQLAVALAAMRAHVPEARLRTLQATFLAPVQGDLFARARVLRRGRSTTFVEARLVEGEDTQAVVTGVFGPPRASTVVVTPAAPAAVRDAPVPLVYVEGRLPRFTQHFAARWRRGKPPFSADATREHVIEVDLRDSGPTTEAHVLALADFIPPIGLSFLAAPAPGSTVSWMLELLTDDLAHLPLAGWRVDATLLAAEGGYTSQSVCLWAPDGTLVARGQQCMMVFA